MWACPMETKVREGNKEGCDREEQGVIAGKVSEHLIPYLPEFRYNPKDARFIGSPIDLIYSTGLMRES